MAFSPDEILKERYKIISKLGTGGMGAVYLAHDKKLMIDVAVKVNFNPSPEAVDQFLQEARLLASLRHANLPRVTDYFVMGSEQFLVMDFIPGDDLGRLLKVQGVQPLQDVLNWADQLCSALDYLHHQNPPVIHRDIKPANIKITPQGETFLVDFGIAKVSGTQQQTAAGACGYTPGYAPPEQYGHGHSSHATDQYALAATLYALLAKTKPADSLERLMGKAALLSLRQMNPEVPQNVEDALLKALSLNPSDRFESVVAFKQALNDPDFRISDDTRNLLTSTVTRKTAAATRLAANIAPTVVEGRKPPRKKIVWVLPLVLVMLLLGVIATALFLFVLPGAPFAISRVQPTQPTTSATSTQAGELQPAPATATPQQATDTPALTLTPTLNMITTAVVIDLSPTPTPEPDWLGGADGVIVFSSDRADGRTLQLWTMQVGRDSNGGIITTALTQLTFGEGDKTQPAWSPDGSRIAFVAPGNTETGLDVWVMDADGSNAQNVTNHRGDEDDPVWHPDGEWLVYTYHSRVDEDGRDITQLYRINADGQNRKRISLEFIESQATFSPDGDYLVYVVSASYHHYLYVRSAYDGYETIRGFDPRSILGNLGDVADPEFSPDGLQLVYTRLEGKARRVIVITFTHMTASGARNIEDYSVSSVNADYAPVWSPDMRWLAFVSTRDDDEEIYLTTTAGRPEVNLTQRDGVDRDPDWKPFQ